MKQKPKGPFISAQRHETIRKEIMSLLIGQALSAKDLSADVHIPEKDVYGHLEHIERSARKTSYHFTVIPAECAKCGFVFKKRERLKKPGRCPICHEEHIREPLFSITASIRH